MKNALLLFAIISFSVVACNAQPAPAPSPEKSATPASKPINGNQGKPSIVLPPEKAQPVKMPRFDKPPVIDGKLDDEAWKQAAVLKDFYQTQPGDNIAPSKPTEVMIGYDAKTLYLGFHCYDDPTKVKATVAKRDQVFGDDNIRVFLD